MSSRRIRSKKTIGTAVANLSTTVTRLTHVAAPIDINSQAVTANTIDSGAIYTSAITDGTISSRTLGLSSYVPNGEGVQRIPAPLNDVEYWEDVIAGLIELHKSGVHAAEDTQNISVSTLGLTFNPTGVFGGDARIFLTGRMSIPKSRKVYATWSNTATIPIKLVYWDDVVPVVVSKVGITDGVVTLTTDSAHGLSVGNSIKVTACGSDYDGIYTVVSTPDTNILTYAAASTASKNINENFLAIEGRVALEVYNYVNLQNKISWEAPLTAGEYAVYAELPYSSSSRTLTEAKVFELIGSGKTAVVSANVNNKTIVSNVATLTTSANHSFKVDDIVNISGVAESATTSVFNVGSGSPNLMTVYTYGPHYFLPGYSVTIANTISPTVIDGTYTILAANTATQFVVETSLPVNATNVSATSTATVGNGVFNGQAKITDITSNTFSYSRTLNGGVPSTAVTPDGLAEVGKPRYAYIQYVQATPSGADSVIVIYTESNNGFSVGEEVSISGLENLYPDSGLDNSFTITVATDKSFTFTIPNSSLTISYSKISASATPPLAYVGSSETSIEMGPDGLRYISAGSSSVDTDLGTTSDNYIGVTRVDGASVASIDNNGGGTFSSLTADQDVTIGGLDLVGTLGSASYNGTTYDGSILDRLARGSVYKATFSLGTSANTTYNVAANTNVTTLAYGKFSVEDGRQYLVSVSPGGLRTNTNVTSVYELLMSTGPMRADSFGPSHLSTSIVTSTATGGDYAPIVATYTSSIDPQMGNSSYTANITAISRATTTVTVTANSHGLVTGDFVSIANTATSNVPNSLYLGTFAATVVNANAFTYTTVDSGTIANAAGGAATKVSSYLSTPGTLPANVDIYWLVRLRTANGPAAYTLSMPSYQPAGTPQMEIAVLDMGQAKPSVVAAKLGYSSGLLDLNVSYNAGATNTRTLVSTTQTVNASDSGYYDNYGRGSGTTDPYAYKYSLYQGDPGTASGVKKSAVLFPAFTLPAGAANVVVSKVEVYLRNRHSYLSTGLTAYIGTHSSSSLGSSIPGISNYGVVSAKFSKGAAAWVTLPSGSYTAFKPGSQTARGIILGATDDNPDTYYSGLNSYGYFDGNTMSDEPKLRVTYTYDI